MEEDIEDIEEIANNISKRNVEDSKEEQTNKRDRTGDEITQGRRSNVKPNNLES